MAADALDLAPLEEITEEVEEALSPLAKRILQALRTFKTGRDETRE